MTHLRLQTYVNSSCMPHTRGDISLESGSVSFYRWGQGPRIIVALHGFGEDGLSFGPWGESLPPGFSLFAPDLPLHGKSIWENPTPFTVDHLHTLIHRMTGSGASFILCGYSMGGRLSLSFVQHYPLEVTRLVLLAPDGLKVNFWYWLSTQTIAGNRLFRSAMEHPSWFLGTVRFLGWCGLLNQGIVKYVRRYLGEAFYRQNLYNIWTCMRTFRPDLGAVRRARIPTRLIFGRHDRIIPASQGYRFQRKAAGPCEVLKLPSGHQLLTGELAAACLQIVTGN
jgi:pimeloyl-ACP methyl ester carboxylesterase